MKIYFTQTLFFAAPLPPYVIAAVSSLNTADRRSYSQ